MRIYIYRGGERLVGKSGVGQAMGHQRESLRRVGIEPTDHWTADTGAVHINTVLPDSAAAAVWARLRGKKVVWYGHSTMEDFRNFKKSKKFKSLIIEVNTYEEEADQLLMHVIRDLHTTDCENTMRVMVWSRIFEHMENCADATEHAADCMSTILLKNV